MALAKGFARTSRYEVIITPPANLAKLAADSTVEGVPQLGIADKVYPGDDNAKTFRRFSRIVGNQVNLHCKSITMPGHDLKAQDIQHGSAPGRQMVQSHDYAGTILSTFYLDSHLRERHFFEMWQNLAVDNETHKAGYYDDYIGSLEILQLGLDDEITYGIKATEVYPTTIAPIEYSYDDANTIALQTVQFQYRQWHNMTTDAISGYTMGDVKHRANIWERAKQGVF